MSIYFLKFFHFLQKIFDERAVCLKVGAEKNGAPLPDILKYIHKKRFIIHQKNKTALKTLCSQSCFADKRNAIRIGGPFLIQMQEFFGVYMRNKLLFSFRQIGIQKEVCAARFERNIRIIQSPYDMLRAEHLDHIFKLIF